MKWIFGRAPCERKRTQPIRCRSDVTADCEQRAKGSENSETAVPFSASNQVLPTPQIIQDRKEKIMNILKLAKHLKEFTIDEIEMIAECNVKTDIENLLNNSKLIFEHGVYKYVDNVEKLNFGIFITNSNKNTVITLEEAVEYFINNYVAKFCSKKTKRIYMAAFKLDILPVLKKK